VSFLQRPLDRRWFLGAVLLAAAAGFLAYLTEVRDPDMFHHMAYGRDIAQHGLRSEEPFLFPLRGWQIGPMPYWLGSFVIYLWASVFGDGAMAWFPALFGALLAMVLMVDATPRRGTWTVSSLLAAAAVMAPLLAFGRYRAFARPELLSTVLLSVVMLAIRRFEEGRPRLLYGLPLLAIVWTNLHPSVPVAVVPIAVMVAAGLLGHALKKLTGRDLIVTPALRPLGLATLVGAATLLAALVTPSPFNPVITSLRFALSSLGFENVGPPAQEAMERMMGFVKRMVLEMQPLGWSSLNDTFGVVCGITVLGFLLNVRRLRLRELLTVAAFAYLGFSAGRFAVMMAVVAAPITARNLGEALEQVPERWLAGWARPATASALLGLAVAGLAWFPVPSVVRFGTGLRSYAYPVRAVDYLIANRIEGPWFNTFHFGGYIEWRTNRMTYQDGRGHISAGEEDASVSGPQNYGLFYGLDRKYHFEALVVNYPQPDPATAASLAASSPDADWGADRRFWALVAFDDGGLLYLRRGGRYAALIERDEFKLVRPANTYLNVPRDQAGLFLAELRRSVAAAPDCVRCRQLLGATASTIGAWDEAWNAVAPLLKGPPIAERAGVMLVGAQAAEGLGLFDDASAIYRQLIALDQEVGWSRRALARLAYKRNDVAEALRLLAPSLQGGGRDPADVAMAIELLRAANRMDEAAAWARRQQQLQTEQMAVQYQDKGQAAVNQGNPQAAITWFEAALSVQETPEARSSLGRIYYGLGRYADAEGQQRRAITLSPTFATGWYGLGEALAARGDRAGAAAAFRRYMEIEPSGFWAAKAKQALDQLEHR
jgi:tetratricopeptide (TPR) repeat protein